MGLSRALATKNRNIFCHNSQVHSRWKPSHRKFLQSNRQKFPVWKSLILLLLKFCEKALNLFLRRCFGVKRQAQLSIFRFLTDACLRLLMGGIFSVFVSWALFRSSWTFSYQPGTRIRYWVERFRVCTVEIFISVSFFLFDQSMFINERKKATLSVVKLRD